MKEQYPSYSMKHGHAKTQVVSGTCRTRTRARNVSDTFWTCLIESKERRREKEISVGFCVGFWK